VLLAFNYQSPDLLADMTEKWARLLEEVQPSLIVADFAPTLRLAHLNDAPFLMIGNGYSVPPTSRVLPPIRPWQPELNPLSRANEADVLKALNQVRQRFAGPSVDYVADMFNGDTSCICTIPEFDPYRRYRKTPTLVPFNVPTITSFTHTSERSRSPILVYLPGNHPQLKAVMAAVSGLNQPCHAYISHVAPEKVAKMAGSNVTIYRKPLNFAKVLPTYRLIIHHAGLGTAYAALKAGTPQLVMPKNLEHRITSRGLEEFGVAIVYPVGARSEPEKIQAAIRRLISEDTIADSAYAAASVFTKQPQGESLDLIVDKCKQLLDRY
jgi:UDP:flavonoid glycosyltransferase YjiC (YdhE family)